MCYTSCQALRSFLNFVFNGLFYRILATSDIHHLRLIAYADMGSFFFFFVVVVILWFIPQIHVLTNGHGL